MPTGLRRPRIVAAQFPVRTRFLEHEREGSGRLAGNIHDHDAVIPRWQVRDHENGAAARLSTLAENTAQELRARDGFFPLRLQEKQRTQLHLRSSEIRLIVSDRRFNAPNPRPTKELHSAGWSPCRPSLSSQNAAGRRFPGGVSVAASISSDVTQL